MGTNMALTGRMGWAATVAAIAASIMVVPGPVLARSHWNDRRTVEQQASVSPVLAMARCYGRFIGWRDELASIMRATSTYTPLPDDPPRFDRLEAVFIAHAQSERHLALHLRPTFAEKDFPRDLRRGFRVGLKEANATFSGSDYRAAKIRLFSGGGIQQASRMQDLEAHADAVFAKLGEPCDRIAALNP